jgi:cytochrome P450
MPAWDDRFAGCRVGPDRGTEWIGILRVSDADGCCVGSARVGGPIMGARMTTDVAVEQPRIDLMDPASFIGGHPHEAFAWLRAHDPVHWHKEPGGPGFWAVTRYEDVKRVSRDASAFSSAQGIMVTEGMRDFGRGSPRMMISMDPPDQLAYRRLAVPDFVPKAVKAKVPRIAELASRIIDGVIERGECDFVTDVSGMLPSYMIAELLGIPLEDGVALYAHTEAVHASPESQEAGAGAVALGQMLQYAHGLWESRRAHPTDDLASTLAHAVVDGEPLSEMDFGLYFVLLIDAGGDTVRNLVATGMLTLLEHPGQLDRLRNDVDDRIRPAIEELLRWVSPVTYMRRTATEDVVIGDREIRAGEKVLMYYGSANHDPAAFADPQRFDIERRPNDHLAFGAGGPHFCLGAHLARAQIEAILREILGRLRGLRLAGPPTWLPSTFISGVQHLPVEFEPGPRVAAG